MLIGVGANTASSKPKRSSEITVQQPDRLNPPDIRTAGIRMVPEDADLLDLHNKLCAVIGFRSQGHAHALKFPLTER
jgi:hypothetical protein